MISIAMTTYNGEKYLREQLDSILTQTYKNFELIICDDCSKDKTRKILTEYEQKDNRIKIYFNEENLGFKKNFEKAISFCNGDYIALSDQDDIWTNNHLEILLNLIGDYDISCGNAILIDEKNHSLNLKLNETDGLFYFQNENLLYRLLVHTACFQGSSMLINKRLFKKALPIPQDVFYHDAWFSVCACLNKGINYTFEIINHYRQHNSQITSHQKQSYFQKIKDFFSRLIKKEKYFTDRFAYINAIKERFSLSIEQSKIIEDCYKIQLMKSKKINFFSRLKILQIYSKYYKDIYTQKNNKYKFYRILKNLF